MKRFVVFFNFGVMPNDPGLVPNADGYDTREEAQAFMDNTHTPQYYTIVDRGE